ncbi:MAG: ABC transporter permease [Alphaproteobacteria bacterium]|nr:ABC transporter permease [Alphaproteobacteria bacterium]
MPDWLRRLLAHPSGSVGCLLLAVALVLAVAGPSLAPFDPETFHPRRRFEGPGLEFWLGTDQFGRDLLSRLLHGARSTILFGVIATAIGTSLGAAVGLASGYAGGLIDEAVMRIMDALLAIPSLLFSLLIVTVLGGSTVNAVAAVAVTIAPGMARIARSVTLSVKSRDFVAAAVARGESHAFTMFREVLPNVAAAVVVEASIRVAFATMVGATLSYLGLGAQPPASDWGLLIAEARPHMLRNAWLVIGPGLGIATITIGFNLFGDALRDALNPRVGR